MAEGEGGAVLKVVFHQAVAQGDWIKKHFKLWSRTDVSPRIISVSVLSEFLSVLIKAVFDPSVKHPRLQMSRSQDHVKFEQ